VAKKIRMMFREDWEAKHKPKPPRPEPPAMKRGYRVFLDKLPPHYESICTGCWQDNAVWWYEHIFKAHDGGGGEYKMHLQWRLCVPCKVAKYKEDGEVSGGRWE